MTFSPEQIAKLEAPLDTQAVKTREQAGQKLSYIEGWHAIAEANRIFGHDAWDRETTLRELGEPQLGKDRYGNDQWRVRFMATATIRVRAEKDCILRQGVGYGSGISKDIGDAFEGAIKEAETDATKRALMTFGWPFGLALYDKSRSNVTDGSKEQRDTYMALAKTAIANASTVQELRDWWRDEAPRRRKYGLSKEDEAGLVEIVEAHKAALKHGEVILAG